MLAAGTTPPGPHRDGVITSLVAKKGRSNRIAVHLDGVFAFELASGVARQAGLRIGDMLSKETQDRLAEDDARHRARERAVRLLALRDRSEREVEVGLQTSGFDPAVISDTVSWLRDLGYLDDERFAVRYAAEKLRAGWGKRRVKTELLRKGLERTLVEAALDGEGVNAPAAAEGVESLVALAHKRFGKQFRLDPEGAERRLAGFLARRGYDWDIIGSVARELRVAAGDGEDATSGLEQDPLIP
jgi:regulatory protein